MIPKWTLALGAMLFLMVGANGAMVWLSTWGHRDLVRPDYYEAGLDEDGTMARNGLSRAPGMEAILLQDSQGWRAETGSRLLEKAACRVRFYRPDNGGEDVELDMGAARPSAEAPGRFVWKGAPVSLRRGYWIARMVWSENGKPVMEKSIRMHIPE
jgi:hypothetical protein